MTVRFYHFVERIGKESAFEQKEKQFVNSLVKESKLKYKNHPKILEIIGKYWSEYDKDSRISHLLLHHFDEIFNFLLRNLFPFRGRGITFKNPKATTRVDFEITCMCHYIKREVDIIKEIIIELGIKKSYIDVLKFIFVFTISTMGHMIEYVFQKPFEFKFIEVHAKPLPNKEWNVVAVITGREEKL